MKSSITFLASLLLAAIACSGQTIDLRLSFKIITTTNGIRPSGITDQLLTSLVDKCNNRLAQYWRGNRFRVFEITNISSPDLNGPSKWYQQEIRDHLDQLEDEAKADARYRWRTNAVNIYIAQSFQWASNSPCWAGGRAHVPSVAIGRRTVALRISDESWGVLHEVGHHFDLYHTQDGVIADANCNISGFNTNASDLVADTIWDVECSDSSNFIAQLNYGMNYLALQADRQKLVDDVLFNVESYHFCTNRETLETRMTEGQLNRWSDSTVNYHRNEVSGRTWFVKTDGTDASSGISTRPIRTVGRGVTNSASGDIIQIRPGNYNERITINKPVTLRATRDGWAVIGKP